MQSLQVIVLRIDESKEADVDPRTIYPLIVDDTTESVGRWHKSVIATTTQP